MSAPDPEAEFYSYFDDLYCKFWSHDVQEPAPEGRFKDKFYHYVKYRCSEVDDQKLDGGLGHLLSDFLEELAG